MQKRSTGQLVELSKTTKRRPTGFEVRAAGEIENGAYNEWIKWVKSKQMILLNYIDVLKGWP